MQIYWNKRKFLLKEKAQLQQDQHGRYFIVSGHQNGGRDVMRKHSDYKLNCSLLTELKKLGSYNRLECYLTFEKIIHESLHNCTYGHEPLGAAVFVFKLFDQDFDRVKNVFQYPTHLHTLKALIWRNF